MVAPLPEELTSHVVRSSALCLQEASVSSREGFHHSEVSDLEHNFVVEEAVLKLQVTMGNVFAVDEGYSCDKLTKELSSVLGSESISHLNVVESLSVSGQLRDNEEVFVSELLPFSIYQSLHLSFTGSTKLKNVGMENLGLTGHHLGVEGFFEFLVKAFE